MHRHDVEVGQQGDSSAGDNNTASISEVDNNAINKTESYDIPLSYVNLNEAEAPPPAENPDELPVARHRSLEEYREEDEQSRREEQRHPTKKHDRRRYGTAISRPFVELYTISYLIFFSLFGTLARLGLSSLTTYTGAPVTFGVLWANFAGTVVLGFLAELSPVINRDHAAEEEEEPKKEEAPAADADDSIDRDLADADPVDEENEEANNNTVAAPAPPAPTPTPAKRPRPIPLYVGLATGFCGSFTSFSSFMLEVFEALANTLPAPKYHPGDDASEVASRGVGYGFMAPLAVLFLTVGMCLSGLKLGAHLAIFLNRLATRVGSKKWTHSHTTTLLRIADNAVVILSFGAWLAAILITVFQPGPAKSHYWRTDVLFALIFAPPGCLLRFYLSLKLNGTFATFPLGTFTVNIFGTATLAMAWDLQHASAVAATRLVGCQVLQGIMDGFCGCLTTVSTWMAELLGLKRRHAYFYGGMSLAIGLVAMVLIVGTPKWTIGWQEPVC
ncbi:hypothetical protein Sste5346_004701 [Sporothrix stenoceras]|uniref:Chromosome condensation protein n=1 Tax=Sporothrix stenoceras TaxID=5173 RepID=A0ABR3Z7W2_9PEZI